LGGYVEALSLVIEGVLVRELR